MGTGATSLLEDAVTLYAGAEVGTLCAWADSGTLCAGVDVGTFCAGADAGSSVHQRRLRLSHHRNAN